MKPTAGRERLRPSTDVRWLTLPLIVSVATFLAISVLEGDGKLQTMNRSASSRGASPKHEAKPDGFMVRLDDGRQVFLPGVKPFRYFSAKMTADGLIDFN